MHKSGATGRDRRGWLTVSAAAVTSGLLDRLGHAAAEHLNRAAEALDADVRGDLTAAGIGIGIGTAYDPGADLARRLATVLSVLARHLDRQGAGMAVTVDELHAGQTDELRTLGIALQDVTRLARLTPFADDDPPRSPTLAAPKHLTGWFTP
ncbi:hypothetical protein [Candidatus Poriferisodalis sp.]|uniref:hypothetical protein n=1 Tax=Candidatus Poriferisodalis sp. TaxID=3101277 RepID=UPI003B02B2A5